MTISSVEMCVMSTSSWNKVSQQMEKKKNYSPKRWHNWYLNETIGSKDTEHDWAQSAEPKDIVLSPNSRVTGQAQIIMVKGVLLLMPKSVNDTLNTKVQHCKRHQVNPVGGLNEGEKWYEDNEDGGKKWWEARSGWRQEVAGGKKQLMPSNRNFHKSPTVLICQRKIPTTSFLFPTFSITFSSSPSTGLTWCLPVALNFGVHCFVHWLWCQ